MKSTKQSTMDSNGEKNTPHLLNYDVFFGRGRMVSKLPGNIKYKELLYANHKAYNLSQSRYERDMIAETIVSTLKQLGTTFWYVPVKTKGSRRRGDHFITAGAIMRSRGGKEEEDEKKITSATEYQHAAAGKAATLPYASYCSCSSSSSPRRVTHDDEIKKKNNNGSTSIKRRMMPPSHQERHHDAEVLPLLHDSEFHNGCAQQPRRPRTKKQQQQQNPAPSFPILLVSSPEDSYSRSPTTTSKEEQEVYYGWEELKPRGKVLRKVKQVRTSSFCMSGETFMHCAFVLL